MGTVTRFIIFCEQIILRQDASSEITINALYCIDQFSNNVYDKKKKYENIYRRIKFEKKMIIFYA